MDKMVKNPGCPLNADCTKEQGLKRKLWSELLRSNPSDLSLSHYVKTHGTPIKAFITNEELKTDFVLWNSQCSEHNQKDNTVFIGETFTKNLNKSFLQVGVYLPKVILLNKDNQKIKFIEIPISQGTFPSYSEGSSLYSNMDFDGFYYGLVTHENGSIKVRNAESFNKFPQPIDCPDDFKDLIEKQKNSDKMTIYHSCRNIWDKKLQTYRAALFSHFCK